MLGIQPKLLVTSRFLSEVKKRSCPHSNKSLTVDMNDFYHIW